MSNFLPKFKWFAALRHHRDPTKVEFNPQRDWRLISAVFILAAAGLFISAYLFYQRFNHLLTVPPAESSETLLQSFKPAAIKSLLQALDARDAKLQELLKAPPVVIDPSL